MQNAWGEAFTLGGLGGVPFAGKSGVRAYLHHVPDSGRLLILFAPHVGVDGTGKVGDLHRFGQEGLATACGAAVGAFKAIKGDTISTAKQDELLRTGTLSTEDKEYAPYDPQISYIKEKLKPKLQGLSDQDEIAFVSYQMYEIVRDLLYTGLRGAPQLCTLRCRPLPPAAVDPLRS